MWWRYMWKSGLLRQFMWRMWWPGKITYHYPAHIKDYYLHQRLWKKPEHNCVPSQKQTIGYFSEGIYVLVEVKAKVSEDKPSSRWHRRSRDRSYFFGGAQKISTFLSVLSSSPKARLSKNKIFIVFRLFSLTDKNTEIKKDTIMIPYLLHSYSPIAPDWWTKFSF